MKTLAPLVTLIAAAVLIGSVALWAPSPAHAEAESGGYEQPTKLKVVPPVWPDDVRDRIAALAVQDGGRVKPLNTYATYALLRMSHKKSVKTADGRKLKPIDWLLDVILYPEAASTYDIFLIETDEISQSIGISSKGKKKRDRYSYDRVAKGRKRLFQLAGEYATIEEKERTKVQIGTLELAHSLREFETLQYFLDYARNPVRTDDVPALGPVLGNAESMSVPHVLAKLPDLIAMARLAVESGGEAAAQELLTQIDKIRQRTLFAGRRSYALDVIAPTKTQQEWIEAAQAQGREMEIDAEAWLSPAAAIDRAIHRPSVGIAAEQVAMLAEFQALVDEREDLGSVKAHTIELSNTGRSLAEGLDLYEKIPLEVSFFKLAPFGHRTTGLFILAFILVALSWNWPNKWLVRSAWTLLVATSILLVVGITMRCILRGRPPISTLYETVIFITTTGVIAALVIEAMTRQRIALALAPIVGIIGLYMAGGYENITREDTMPKLLAVLDTNFWLASHVTCIAIGYMGALLQALVAHVYVLGKVFGIRKGDKQFYKTLTSFTYGLLGFGLIFAIVGTILGGIWANYSWGRFWGWDPKENGALMIVLFQLALIHARMGGLIRSWGLAIGSILLGGIVAFSWWGVNLLGIGLHTYGFTSGIMNSLLLFYGFELVVLLLATAWYLIRRDRVDAARI